MVGLHGDDKSALTRAAEANDASAQSVRFWVQKYKNDGSADQLIAAHAITNLAEGKKKRKKGKGKDGLQYQYGLQYR